MPIRIAVDGMGGDNAPSEVVKGALEAARDQEVQILLVGEPDSLHKELKKYGPSQSMIQIVSSHGVIAEGEPPAMALRQKPEASIAIATGLLKHGKADALVTMGSTGAAMASATIGLGLLEGLDRPALGGPFLGLAPRTTLLDLGSNLDCRPSQMLSFAVIGCIFARQFLGINDPSVGLLSVGSEEGKGNKQTKEAYELFNESGLNFVGNVEGMDLFTNKADVIVCDGFVGNIMMKFAEGLSKALAHHVSDILSKHLPTDQADAIALEIMSRMNNPESTVGPLFGVNGVIIVGHGSSKAASVSSAIALAKRAVQVDLVTKLRTDIAEVLQRVRG